MKLFVPVILLCSMLLSSFETKAQTGNGNSSDRMYLRARLYAANGNIADGALVAFDDDFSNGYDNQDGLKMMNPGENLGMRRDGRILAVEARHTLTAQDTIFYDTRNLAQQTYQIKFTPTYMNNVTMFAILQDKFTGNSTNVSLTDSTFFFFTVTSNPASKAFDRFKLYFIDLSVAGGALPVKFTHTALKENSNGSVHINWAVAEQLNINEYNIERSSNGSIFKTIAKVPAKAAPSGSATYEYTDKAATTAESFYRITATDIDGKTSYSKIIKTNTAKLEAQMAVWPNPLTTPQLQVKITGAAKGMYQVAVSNQAGQKVYVSKINISTDSQLLSLNLGSSLAKGRYTVFVTGADGTSLQQPLIVQ